MVYLAVKAGGESASDAYKALAVVGIWLLIGAIWFVVNPNTRGKKILDSGAPKREVVATSN